MERLSDLENKIVNDYISLIIQEINGELRTLNDRISRFNVPSEAQNLICKEIKYNKNNGCLKVDNFDKEIIYDLVKKEAIDRFIRDLALSTASNNTDAKVAR